MKKFYPLLLSMLSGILLWVAWPVSPFCFVIFFAWTPLFFMADITIKKISFFFYCLITMLIWNASTTWWIWNSTDVGSIGAIAANSLLMTLPWWGYRVIKRNFNNALALASLIIFWMCFEYIHLNWQLSWPWLTLGNAFANHTGWVQWYQFTGTSGGTLWVLLVNIFLYELIKRNQSAFNIRYAFIAVAAIGIPIIISVLVKPGTEPIAKENVIIVQPNIDPYNKFQSDNIAEQINTLISLSEKQIDSNTRLVVWPETAIASPTEQQQVYNAYYCKPVFDFIKRHRNIMLISGIESFIIYGKEKLTATAHYDENAGIYFDEFNSAMAASAGGSLQFYNKRKLVPGVETLPDFLRWMSPVFEKFGGTASGYGRSKESIAFSEPQNPYIAAPIICYESIYGEYVSTYVKKGANILTIITNDGWWGNTPGHKQHLAYARLRAIETRKWIARSANTGISAVIDKSGNIIASQPWNKATFIKAAIPTEEGETFYVKYGDILSKTASIATIAMLLWNFIFLMRRKK